MIRYTGLATEEMCDSPAPYGVVAAIIPWNYPSALVTRKLGPCAAGNAIVIKADEKTPLSALAIGEIVARSGMFPTGWSACSPARERSWAARWCAAPEPIW